MTWAKEHAGRVCLLDAHAFLGELLFKPSVLLTRRHRHLASWVNTSIDNVRVNNSSLLLSNVYPLARNLSNPERNRRLLLVVRLLELQDIGLVRINLHVMYNRYNIG